MRDRLANPAFTEPGPHHGWANRLGYTPSLLPPRIELCGRTQGRLHKSC